MIEEDRTAIVIGGTGGIGSAISRRLASQGHRVVVAGQNAAQAQEVADSLEGSGHSGVRIDVTDEEQLGEAFDRIEAETPAAILVVSSGGPVADLSKRPTIATLDAEDWRRTIDLNLTGVFYAMQKFAQLRVARPLEHARIVTISSTSGQVAQEVIDISYSTSKAGMFGLTRQAAFDLAGVGVTVNTVASGVVGTPAFMENTTEEIRAAASAGTLLKRLATPEEIAAGVTYLTSRDAAYVTGTTLNVNGGIYMN